MVDLAELLADNGIDLTGWQLEEAVAVSADGTVILGNGINPSGDPEAWLVQISAFVLSVASLEPAALVLLIGLILLAGALASRPTAHSPSEAHSGR